MKTMTKEWIGWWLLVALLLLCNTIGNFARRIVEAERRAADAEEWAAAIEAEAQELMERSCHERTN